MRSEKCESAKVRDEEREGMTNEEFRVELEERTLVFAVGPMKTILSKPDADTLNEMLARTGKLLIIYSVLFAIGWAI